MLYRTLNPKRFVTTTQMSSNINSVGTILWRRAKPSERVAADGSVNQSPGRLYPIMTWFRPPQFAISPGMVVADSLPFGIH